MKQYFIHIGENLAVSGELSGNILASKNQLQTCSILLTFSLCKQKNYYLYNFFTKMLIHKNHCFRCILREQNKYEQNSNGFNINNEFQILKK